MNLYGIRAIYGFEMARTFRTLFQSIASPVLSTSLYFIVFGSAIGSRMTAIHGVSYGAFIVPGLLMLSILTESVSNASFGIYLPRFSGTIFEVLSAPIAPFEVVLGYVGAAATKSILLGILILATARLFVSFGVAHPLVDARVLGAHVGDLQPVRVRHRHLGRRLREASAHPNHGRAAAHVPRRELLLDQHAAGDLAEDRARPIPSFIS